MKQSIFLFNFAELTHEIVSLLIVKLSMKLSF